MTEVKAFQCPSCKDVVYSRAHYDYRQCSCGEIYVDGGFEYTRLGWRGSDDPKQIMITVEATKKELYDDWNRGSDVYGLIKHTT